MIYLSHHVWFNLYNFQAELILECLDVSREYNEQLSKAIADKTPPIPLQMQAYNCTNTEDYLLETVKRIRGR